MRIEKKNTIKKKTAGLDNLNDEDLIVFVREKDKQAYSLIMDRYGIKIGRYINRLINNDADAQDLVQQVFINVYTDIFSFDEKRKFSSWIYRVAHNVAVNYFRKKKIKISLESNPAVANKLFSKDDVFEEVTREEAKDKMVSLLDELPEKFKTPLILRFQEDKTYEEISDILRIPKNTVGTLISRAKKSLKKEIEKKDERGK
jgi:RNA polymerase sigma-70 factor (ECF subfamily)